MPDGDEERGGLSRLVALPLDGRAASRATVLAVLAMICFVTLQPVVGAALPEGDQQAALDGGDNPVVGGTQPMPRVETVPVRPAASAWKDAPSRSVSLSKQQMAVPFGGGTTDSVDVSALANESHVAVRFSWQDPTADDDIASPRTYSDAAALMLANGEVPPITMGASGDPVNIWYWRAAWGSNASGFTAGDMYAYPHDDNETRPGAAAGNPVSTMREQGAHNYYARGFGSLTYAPTQPVQAAARRTDDGWQVTFVRERGTEGAHEASFAANETVYLAFAIWNGSADEANGQKSISLQFTRLDTQHGELGSANAGGSGGSAASSGGAAAGEGSGREGGEGASDPARDLVEYSGVLVIVVVTVWLLAYWSVRE